MTYLALNLVFLALAAVGTGVALAVARRRGTAPRPRAVLLAAAVMLLLTAVFDNVIIGTGLVDYHPEAHLGLRLGLAPIEDFAYTIAALALLPALWSAIHREER
ncbi:MAG: lycopene cyclase domain-containing protein [Actinomycetales bacterium]|nr:lycopene cyclase domain-containing protein [Actinomycetales bacterium]